MYVASISIEKGFVVLIVVGIHRIYSTQLGLWNLSPLTMVEDRADIRSMDPGFLRLCLLLFLIPYSSL